MTRYNEPYPEPIIIKCSKCKKKTEHSQHGFRGHNYRQKCKICGEINYYEKD